MRVEWRKGDKFKHRLWGKFTRCSNNSFGSLGEGRGRVKDDPHSVLEDRVSSGPMPAAETGERAKFTVDVVSLVWAMWNLK